VAGRFGWQATEPTIAAQTATAFAREMGLTTSLVSHIDCGNGDSDCKQAATGGTPEVELDLFGALVTFQKLHAVPTGQAADPDPEAGYIFDELGCAACHQTTLPVVEDNATHTIRAYTDLLLHDLGEGLADRDLSGQPIRSKWRTAPLWGMRASALSGQPLRLLHDGRAHSVAEAILWHGGQAESVRDRYVNLPAWQRRRVEEWIARR
jgi:CxxC motif-containing protein (DUF1111 family)